MTVALKGYDTTSTTSTTATFSNVAVPSYSAIIAFAYVDGTQPSGAAFDGDGFTSMSWQKIHSVQGVRANVFFLWIENGKTADITVTQSYTQNMGCGYLLFTLTDGFVAASTSEPITSEPEGANIAITGCREGQDKTIYGTDAVEIVTIDGSNGRMETGWQPGFGTSSDIDFSSGTDSKFWFISLSPKTPGSWPIFF